MIAGADLSALGCDVAVDVADALNAAFEGLPVILQGRENLTTAEAIMRIGYALLYQRGMHYEELLKERGEQFSELLDALHGGVESLDFLAARPSIDIDQYADAIKHQAHLDFEWLSWLVGEALPDLNEGQRLAIHTRIARLAGL